MVETSIPRQNCSAPSWQRRFSIESCTAPTRELASVDAFKFREIESVTVRAQRELETKLEVTSHLQTEIDAVKNAITVSLGNFDSLKDALSESLSARTAPPGTGRRQR